MDLKLNDYIETLYSGNKLPEIYPCLPRFINFLLILLYEIINEIRLIEFSKRQPPYRGGMKPCLGAKSIGRS